MWHLQSYWPSRSMQSAWWSHTWLSSKTILKGCWSARLHRCWWQMLQTKSVVENFEDVGDGFSRFGYQHLLSLYISEGMNIQKMSPTSRCHKNYCNPRNFLPEHSLILSQTSFSLFIRYPFLQKQLKLPSLSLTVFKKRDDSFLMSHYCTSIKTILGSKHRQDHHNHEYQVYIRQYCDSLTPYHCLDIRYYIDIWTMK